MEEVQMFESIILEYLNNTKYRHWSIISILEYTKSKCQLYVDSINVLRDNIYVSLQRYKESRDNHINVTNKLSKILSDFEKSFSTAEVKEFIVKLQKEQGEHDFDMALQFNVTSASTVKALKGYRTNQMLINELKDDEYEEEGGPSYSKVESRKWKNKVDTKSSSEEETDFDYVEKPNKVCKKGSTNDDSFETPPPRSQSKTVMTTPQKPTLFADSVKYLDNHFSVVINQQCVIMKEIKVDIIPGSVHDWLLNVLSFFNDQRWSVKPLYWGMKVHSGKNRAFIQADSVGMKVSNNKEIIFIEVSGGPENTVPKHVKEDSEKLIKEAMFGLVSLLRDYLDKNAENVENICTYMVQVIGNVFTAVLVHLNNTNLTVIKSAVLPFSFNEIEKFFEIFKLLYALISGFEGQINELKKLAFTNSTDGVPTVQDWIWVPKSIAEWESIEIRENESDL
ncbi:2784_t:CDS:10 [Entrophospora sp. SA101]|nr:2784_t:CDS:10 [Entrophospora sp. SA101]